MSGTIQLVSSELRIEANCFPCAQRLQLHCKAQAGLPSDEAAPLQRMLTWISAGQSWAVSTSCCTVFTPCCQSDSDHLWRTKRKQVSGPVLLCC